MKQLSGWFGAICFTTWAMCAPASAQMRVGGDGHALDANSEVGSGGYNQQQQKQGVTGNDITYGNVTGGFAFQGRVPFAFSDPSGFAEPLPGEQVDAFIRDSTGVPSLDHPMVTPQYSGPHVFYSKTDSPIMPDGYSSNSAVSGNFIATPPPTQQDLALDLRLGAPLDFNSPLPKPGDLLIPGQVDAMAQANPANPTPPVYFMASPLYGVRQLGATDQNGNPLTASASGNFNGQNSTSQQGQNFGPLSAIGRPNSRQQNIMAMRKELIQSAKGQQQVANDQTNLASQPLNPLTPGGDNTQQNPNQPLSSDQAISNQVQPSVLTPVAGDVSTGPLNNADTLALLPAPAQQSTQIAELQKRLAQYKQANPVSEEESTKQFLDDLQKRDGIVNPTEQNSGEGSANGTGQAGSATGLTSPLVAPALPSTVAPAAPPPTPMQIKSLATGISAGSLAKLLRNAEDQTRKGEYAKAIEAYDDAASAAPNNALVPLGRANAELGGSYYSQAETDLRMAFKQDNSLLLAQYDLSGLLGAKRLQYIVSDLKELASDSPQNPTPVFLLAYIAYNTHHEDRAAGWLDVAQRRAGGTDDLIPVLKRYWTFNQYTPPATQP
jgi:tetratricopeptide (TPR) repeat protein